MEDLSENKPKSKPSNFIEFAKRVGWLLIATGSYICIIWILANTDDD
jgi:hypothetical protein